MGTYTFFGSQLTGVDFSTITGAKEIVTGPGMFSNTKVANITWPTDSNVDIKLSGQTFRTTKLTAIIIPAIVTLIDKQCFQDNDFTSITIDDRTDDFTLFIGENAFTCYSTSHLSSVTIPDNVHVDATVQKPVFSGTAYTNLNITVGDGTRLADELAKSWLATGKGKVNGVTI